MNYAFPWPTPRRRPPCSYIKVNEWAHTAPQPLPIFSGLVGNREADFSSSVENEWLCMNLLSAFALAAANTEILRFVRQLHSSGGWMMRRPA